MSNWKTVIDFVSKDEKIWFLEELIEELQDELQDIKYQDFNND